MPPKKQTQEKATPKALPAFSELSPGVQYETVRDNSVPTLNLTPFLTGNENGDKYYAKNCTIFRKNSKIIMKCKHNIFVDDAALFIRQCCSVLQVDASTFNPFNFVRFITIYFKFIIKYLILVPTSNKLFIIILPNMIEIRDKLDKCIKKCPELTDTKYHKNETRKTRELLHYLIYLLAPKAGMWFVPAIHTNKLYMVYKKRNLLESYNSFMSSNVNVSSSNDINECPVCFELSDNMCAIYQCGHTICHNCGIECKLRGMYACGICRSNALPEWIAL
jgi:hypothetical protein